MVILGDNYVHYTLFRWRFSSWKITFFFFFKRNLRYLRIRCFVETCVIFQFCPVLCLQGIFSGLDLWRLHNTCYQKNILPLSLLESILSVSLLHCHEQVFSQHLRTILMHKMRKTGHQKKKIGINFCDWET